MTTDPRDDDLRHDDRDLGDKVRDAADKVAGKAKKKWGDLTDDERLEAEGARQEQQAELNETLGRGTDGPVQR
ncbi:CsbD family protein [Tessaracoccus sp. HDW20]|uniref:CsbD family protein n=1 Tax=Tessaracoccus coleopterorum TaxID=2714950 RepID=UPI0018D453C6|nr:CsbD family protein [Tessaracoccus coleopterorum]NHB85947.1 CsbD family protein [Tessaracoccus coleopterorum]